MNTAESLPSAAVMKRDTTTHTRLPARWVGPARIGWFAVAALCVATLVASVPNQLAYVREICTQPPCAIQLDAQGIARLEAVGLSIDFFVVTTTATLSIAIFGFMIMGTLIFWRRSDDWMALFVSLSLFTFGALIGLTIEISTNHMSEWSFAVNLVAFLGQTSILIFPFLFPDGRFVPRWTRWLAIPIVLMMSLVFGRGFLPDILRNIVTALSGVFFVVGVFAQVYRYRAVSGPAQRQQSKWLAIGLAGAALAFLVSTSYELFVGPLLAKFAHPWSTLVVFAVAMVALTQLPRSIMIAMTRYRLWDVDYVINRSLVYGGVAFIVAVIFIGGFFILRGVVELIVGEDQPILAAVIPAIAATALYSPARRRMRGVVDRYLYGINVEYRDTPAPAPKTPTAGSLRTSVGEFHDLEPIGRGGMAEIYRADHPTLGKPVAIKVLPAQLAQDADFQSRFDREARLVAGLKHPNIVQVYEYGVTDGMHYMVLEYIKGRDLGELIRERAPLPLDRAHAILADIAAALDYAHAQGLVHRDIKPSNVMIETPPPTPPLARGGETGEGFGRAVLMDFGIARMMGGATRLTATGIMGTFDYMSPEQINDSHDVDARTDIYALGVVAFQMLTGRLPFKAGNTGALLMAHLRQPPPDPREFLATLPEPVCAAVVRAMDKKPESRFQTAGEFGAALV